MWKGGVFIYIYFNFETKNMILNVSDKWKGTNKTADIHLKCKYNKKGGTYYMQYDWKKIINSQKESTLTVKEFCRQNNICVLVLCQEMCKSCSG